MKRFLGIVLLLFAALPAVAQDKPSSPGAVLAGFKSALESGNVKNLASLTAGTEGVTLRRLADSYGKVKMASDRLDKTLADKGVSLTNPFASCLTPFADSQFDIVGDVEVQKEGQQVLARIRIGPRGKTQEESVLVKNEDSTWRVTPPAELAKTLRSLATGELLDRRSKGLDRLADVLDNVAKEVENGSLKTKDAVLLRLVKFFNDQNLAELLG